MCKNKDAQLVAESLGVWGVGWGWWGGDEGPDIGNGSVLEYFAPCPRGIRRIVHDRPLVQIIEVEAAVKAPKHIGLAILCQSGAVVRAW